MLRFTKKKKEKKELTREQILSNIIGKIQLVVFAIFLTLKLNGSVNWSWWKVTSPLWVPPVVGYSILGILAIPVLIKKIVEWTDYDF